MSGSIIWAALAAIGLFGGSAMLYAGARRRARTLLDLQGRVAQLERDWRALCTAQAQAGDRLVIAERELRRIAGGQSRLEMRAPSAGSYRQAASLASHGAGIDELVETCGLARGEAELLSRVHGGQASRERGGETAPNSPAREAESVLVQ